MDASLAAAHRSCRSIAHEHGANFSVGFRFLPASKRRAVYAAYAWCRVADDIADEPGERIEERLDVWQAGLDRCYEGSPDHPITIALADALEDFAIPKRAFVDLVDGCRQDMWKTRYETFDELLEYCRLVAASISDISLAIFGYSDPSAIDRGRDLSTALQLTNICRDVGDDLDRDRIYLPREDLERFGISEAALQERERTESMREMLEFQISRARSYFESAEPLIATIDRDARLPVGLMGGIYATILGHLSRNPFIVFDRRFSLSLAQKLAVVARRLHRPTFVL